MKIEELKKKINFYGPKKHLVTILNQPRHKYEYKRHDKNKFKT